MLLLWRHFSQIKPRWLLDKYFLSSSLFSAQISFASVGKWSQRTEGDTNSSCDQYTWLDSRYSNFMSDWYDRSFLDWRALNTGFLTWRAGVGFDVLANIIGHVMPTHVIQIRTKSARRNLPTNQFWKSKETKKFPELLFVDSVIEDHAELWVELLIARSMNLKYMFLFFTLSL